MKGSNRRELIANTALRIFATKGYVQTSTKQIAKEAGVSEALIFKHYGTKEQLLALLITSGYKRVIAHNLGPLQEEDPQRLIYNVLDMPYKLLVLEPYFWQLQYRLLDMDISIEQHTRFLRPLTGLLLKAFTALGYTQPLLETRAVLLLIDALWKNHVWRNMEELPPIIAFLKGKYTRSNVSMSFHYS